MTISRDTMALLADVLDAEGVVLCPRCAGTFVTSNLVGEFLNDFCMFDRDMQEPALHVHEAFVAWCVAVKGLDEWQAPSLRAFSAAVQGRVEKQRRNGVAVWHGIKLWPRWKERLGIPQDGAA